jgi:hypothetical protein
MISTYNQAEEPEVDINSEREYPKMDLIRLMNIFIDRVMGIGKFEVLNPSISNSMAGNPAQELMRITRALKAEAINASGERVDYTKLAASETYQQFKHLASTLPHYDIEALEDRDEKIAFWINLYNTLIFNGIISYKIRKSILSKPSFFRRAAYNVGGFRFSADDIEHGILRGNRPHPIFHLRPFGASDPRRGALIRPLDPRIHFSLVCGARSCPPIRFYDPDLLEEQLSQSATSFVDGGGTHYDATNGTLWLSRIFKWYQADFGGITGVKRVLQRYSLNQKLLEILERKGLRIKYFPYDWSINRIA